MPAWLRAVSFEAQHSPAQSHPKLSSVGARKVAEYAFGSKGRGGTIMAWRKDDNYRSKVLWHREHVMPLLDALAQKLDYFSKNIENTQILAMGRSEKHKV